MLRVFSIFTDKVYTFLNYPKYRKNAVCFDHCLATNRKKQDNRKLIVSITLRLICITYGSPRFVFNIFLIFAGIKKLDKREGRHLNGTYLT